MGFRKGLICLSKASVIGFFWTNVCTSLTFARFLSLLPSWPFCWFRRCVSDLILLLLRLRLGLLNWVHQVKELFILCLWSFSYACVCGLWINLHKTFVQAQVFLQDSVPSFAYLSMLLNTICIELLFTNSASC